MQCGETSDSENITWRPHSGSLMHQLKGDEGDVIQHFFSCRDWNRNIPWPKILWLDQRSLENHCSCGSSWSEKQYAPQQRKLSIMVKKKHKWNDVRRSKQHTGSVHPYRWPRQLLHKQGDSEWHSVPNSSPSLGNCQVQSVSAFTGRSKLLSNLQRERYSTCLVPGSPLPLQGNWLARSTRETSEPGGLQRGFKSS